MWKQDIIKLQVIDQKEKLKPSNTRSQTTYNATALYITPETKPTKLFHPPTRQHIQTSSRRTRSQRWQNNSRYSQTKKKTTTRNQNKSQSRNNELTRGILRRVPQILDIRLFHGIRKNQTTSKNHVDGRTIQTKKRKKNRHTHTHTHTHKQAAEEQK